LKSRGFKNKDVQFLFNRPDRPVNSGRISLIWAGTYSNSNEIPEAQPEELDKFLRQRRDIYSAVGPVDHSTIQTFFKQDPSGMWRLVMGETDEHECKTSFGFKYAPKWLRAIAALANNRGGYLLFGVHDQDKKGPSGEDYGNFAEGLHDSEFESADPVEFTKRLKALFDPTPRIHTTTVKVGGNTVGVIYVERHSSRPVWRCLCHWTTEFYHERRSNRL
jgi:hypothetical protein